MNHYPIVAIIGAGTMAEAIIAGLLRDGLTVADHILASEPRLERREELKEKYKIQTFAENIKALDGAEVVILSVKPQKLSKVMEGLCHSIPENALVLSIVAGASLQKLRQGLNHDSIVRSMPNTPAQIGEGITVWVSSPAVTKDQEEFARKILGAFGPEIQVEEDEEAYLDMATALSGSGPAYVFLFMEAMIDAGVHLGFPRHIAERLVIQTLIGSVQYYEKMKRHPATLRNQVTSPGGTSAAALYYLEKAGVRTAISRAIWAAYERSQELGKGKEAEAPEKKWQE